MYVAQYGLCAERHLSGLRYSLHSQETGGLTPSSGTIDISPAVERSSWYKVDYWSSP